MGLQARERGRGVVLQILRSCSQSRFQIPTAALVSRRNRRQEPGRTSRERLDERALRSALDRYVEEQGRKPEQRARDLGFCRQAGCQLEDAGPVDELRALQSNVVAGGDRPELGHDRSERLGCDPCEPQLPESLRDRARQPRAVSGLDEAPQPVALCQLVQDAGHDGLRREPPDRSELVLDESVRSELRGQASKGGPMPAKGRALAQSRRAQQVASGVRGRRDDQNLGGWKMRGEPLPSSGGSELPPSRSQYHPRHTDLSPPPRGQS